MEHVDRRRLEHFLACADAGSILGAAERVHLSQPAVSRSIRDLEDFVGVALLERHARGVRPTVPLVKELLRSSAFVSVLPREVVHHEVRAGQLVAKRIGAPPRAGTAGAMTRAGAVLPSALDLLVAAVEQERKRVRLAAPARDR